MLVCTMYICQIYRKKKIVVRQVQKSEASQTDE